MLGERCITEHPFPPTLREGEGEVRIDWYLPALVLGNGWAAGRIGKYYRNIPPHRGFLTRKVPELKTRG